MNCELKEVEICVILIFVFIIVISSLISIIMFLVIMECNSIMVCVVIDVD